MSRGAVIAAFEGELGPLTRGWGRANAAGAALWSRRSGETEITAACAGAGAAAAERAFRAAEEGGRIDWVASIGWAGALNEGLVAGKAYPVAELVDAAGGERFKAASLPLAAAPPGLRLVSVQRVAGLEEKQGLRADFGADLVDMEGAAVARMAKERGIPFYCVKGVSDGAGEPLPDLNRFMGADGAFRTAPFVGYALLRPRYWAGLIRMGIHSRRAAGDIAKILEDLIAPR
ncbi:MAG TPA: hypothetical protein VK914_07655 [bacterium]|jgi:adenosylhomocysteine nucleosidase|nr:hypothetical protein [bacterium]